MSVLYAITAVPERRAWVRDIQRRVPGAVVYWDARYNGPWWNTRNVLHSIPAECSHVCILQDDAAPAPNYAEHVERIIAALPDAIVSGHSGMYYAKRIEKAIRDGCHFWAKEWGCPGVNLIIPRGKAVSIARFADEYFEFTKRADDLRIGIWQKMTGTPTWFCAPEIASHMGGAVSTIGYRTTSSNPTHRAGEHEEWGAKLEAVVTYPAEKTLLTIARNFVASHSLKPLEEY